MGRHGRRNREKLRAWKGEQNPEYQARIEKAAQEMRDPDTGRLLVFKKYADRRLLVMTGGDQNNPELRWIHYDEIAQRNHKRRNPWVSKRMTRKFGRNADLPQRCWYTGMQLYLVPWEVFYANGEMTPWMCSREHLVCERNGGADRPSNLVIAGRYINDKLGHSPLPLKLAHRNRFAKMDVDRERPTYSALGPWIDAIVEFESEYKLGRHFPWQPWAFEEGSYERRLAEAFNADMMAQERAFLALDDEGRRQWIEEFRWRW